MTVSVGEAQQRTPPRPNGLPAVQVDELSVRFDTVRAVDGISFDVKRGEIFGLLGSNGAGKTTTIRVLTTLLPLRLGHAN